MKTLTRYIGRELLAAILLIFGGLVMLFAFFDLIHELGDVGRGNYTLSSALLFVALQLPSRMYELFPVAALIGTLFAMAQLVANSEYTVMRASGASLAQVTWALIRIGIPLAIATFLAGEFIARLGGLLLAGIVGQRLGRQSPGGHHVAGRQCLLGPAERLCGVGIGCLLVWGWKRRGPSIHGPGGQDEARWRRC